MVVIQVDDGDERGVDGRLVQALLSEQQLHRGDTLVTTDDEAIVFAGDDGLHEAVRLQTVLQVGHGLVGHLARVVVRHRELADGDHLGLVHHDAHGGLGRLELFGCRCCCCCGHLPPRSVYASMPLRMPDGWFGAAGKFPPTV
jgi:hypothetical protein